MTDKWQQVFVVVGRASKQTTRDRYVDEGIYLWIPATLRKDVEDWDGVEVALPGYLTNYVL